MQLVAVVCLANHNFPEKMVSQELSHASAELAGEHLNSIRDFAKCELPMDRVPSTLLVSYERSFSSAFHCKQSRNNFYDTLRGFGGGQF